MRTTYNSCKLKNQQHFRRRGDQNYGKLEDAILVNWQFVHLLAFLPYTTIAKRLAIVVNWQIGDILRAVETQTVVSSKIRYL